jgi:uncharacterized membrane protein
MQGSVHFKAIDQENTEVTLVIEYEPLGVAENLADKLGVLSLRVGGDLCRFKKFIEERRAATGAWRGEIREGSRS